MSNALTTLNGGAVTTYSPDWARHQEKLDLLKRTVAEGTSNDEFALFVEVAKSAGLNPFQRQIYAIMRNVKVKDRNGDRWEKRMTIQTGIDGYRLIAARTGVHAGTSDAEFGSSNKQGQPEWARVTVRKLLPGGHIAEFPATARWEEYVQTDKSGNPTGMWEKMPFNQLAKCAEALALRKAFPAELSGIYTAEEMSQADNGPTASTSTEPQQPVKDDATKAKEAFLALTGELAKAAGLTAAQCKVARRDFLRSAFDVESTRDLSTEQLRAARQMISDDNQELTRFFPAKDLVMDAEVVTADDDIPPFETGAQADV